MSGPQILAAVLATVAGVVAVVADETAEAAPPAAALAGGVTVGFAVLLFAGAVPRAQDGVHPGPRAAETALVTSVVGFLSVASAWTGLPFVLGTGGAMLGSAARRNASRERERGVARLAIVLGVVAVALGVMTVAPASASAATVSFSARTMTVTAGTGEANDVTITFNGTGTLIGTYTVADSGAPLTAGAGCGMNGANVICPATGADILARAVVSLGDGTDRLATANLTNSSVFDVEGGDGADVITTGPAADIIDGGAGPDTINGGDGFDTIDYSTRTNAVQVTLDGVTPSGEIGENDFVAVENARGGLGNDILTGNDAPNDLRGGPGSNVLNGAGGDDWFDQAASAGGADEMNGGAGADTVDYDLRTTSVRVTLDDVADDGGTGEGDKVQVDVENVRGGKSGDVLTGSGVANRLEGREGVDTLSGGGGDDTFVEPATVESDVFSGGDGMDTVNYAARGVAVQADLDGLQDDGSAGESDFIQAGIENLTGGSKADVLTGNDGPNTLNGDSQDDTLDGRGGADVFIGGSGSDTADYSSRTAQVTVGPTGSADDGEAGEGDTFSSDMEGIKGGSADDVLTGNDVAGTIEGGGGNDTIDGGLGADVLTGGNGGDTIMARETSADTVTCGAGTDGVTADSRDLVAADCESVSLPGGSDPTDPTDPPPTDPTDPTDPTNPTDPTYPTDPAYPEPEPDFPEPDYGWPEPDSPSDPSYQGATDSLPPEIAVEVIRRRLRKVLRRGVAVHAGCFESCRISLKLRLSRKTARKLGLPRTAGAGSRGLAPAGLSVVTAALTRRAKRQLKGNSSVRFALVVTATDAAGNQATTRRRMTVRR